MRTARLLFVCIIAGCFATAALAAESPEVKAEWWGKAPGQKPVAAGTVANVSSSNIAVQTKTGVKPFVISDKTRVRVRGEKAAIGDVSVGDPVVVHFRLQNDNVPLALAVTVPRPNIHGKVIAINADSFIVKGKDTEVSVTTNADTKFVSHGYQGSFADIRIGYAVAAIGAPVDGGFLAARVDFVPATAKGTVVAVDGATITVKTVRQLNLVFQASDATAVLVRPRVGPNVKGTLADVKVGAPVNVGFHPNPGGPAPLLWIDILTGM